MNKKAKFAVTASMSEQERDLCKTWADAQGLSLSKWARQTLLDNTPEDMRAHLLGRDAVLDRPPKALPAEHPAPSRPHKEPFAPSSGPVSDLDDAPVIPDHACVHIRRFYIAPFSPRDCLGTCVSQWGKPCSWNSSSAPQCPSFSPRRFQVGRGAGR